MDSLINLEAIFSLYEINIYATCETVICPSCAISYKLINKIYYKMK